MLKILLILIMRAKENYSNILSKRVLCYNLML